MNNIVFVVDVSDLRNKYLYEGLVEDGYIVEEYEFKKYEDNDKTYIFIFSPTREISMDIAKTIAPRSIVFYLKLDDEKKRYFAKYNIDIYNYFDDEVLAHKNAYLTAEGAVADVINNTIVSLRYNNILVLGYGRLGNAIASLLKGNGANVYVAVNSNVEKGRASLIADYVCNIQDCKKHLKHFSAIINTIPSIVITNEDMLKIDKDCYILDLASGTGGIDKNIDKYNIKYSHFLGVPAKVAPKTSGEYFRESIYKTLATKGKL